MQLPEALISRMLEDQINHIIGKIRMQFGITRCSERLLKHMTAELEVHSKESHG